MKKCPYCAEEIQDDAVKCKHCGEWLNKKESIEGVDSSSMQKNDLLGHFSQNHAHNLKKNIEEFFNQSLFIWKGVLINPNLFFKKSFKGFSLNSSIAFLIMMSFFAVPVLAVKENSRYLKRPRTYF